MNLHDLKNSKNTAQNTLKALLNKMNEIEISFDA